MHAERKIIKRKKALSILTLVANDSLNLTLLSKTKLVNPQKPAWIYSPYSVYTEHRKV